MAFTSLDEAKNANVEAGKHFFDTSSMRFFRSEIESGIITMRDGRQYFVTSEQFVGSDGYVAPRLYTIRQVMPDGAIETHGEFQAYESKRDALQELGGMYNASHYPGTAGALGSSS